MSHQNLPPPLAPHLPFHSLFLCTPPFSLAFNPGNPAYPTGVIWYRHSRLASLASPYPAEPAEPTEPAYPNQDATSIYREAEPPQAQAEPEQETLALSHFITEQSVHAWYTWAGDIDPSTLDFGNAWKSTHPRLRGMYLERAAFLLESGLQVVINQRVCRRTQTQPQGSGSGETTTGYENFFAALYTSYYESHDVGAIIAEDAVSCEFIPAWLAG